MTLRLTPEMLARAYEYLAHTPPFDKWGLPFAEDVDFRIIKNKTVTGQYAQVKAKPTDRKWRHGIFISANCVGHTTTLMMVMAHEMVHLYQEHASRCTPNSEHNADFKRLAAEVCRHHGFDPRLF